jgi:hypothetical protein
MDFTCGAVLIDQENRLVHFFGIVICDQLTEVWRREGKRQLVTEAELLPILLARLVWVDLIRGSKLISFIDSNPARFSCIKGSCESVGCNEIVKAINLFEAKHEIWTWFARAPSFSNCADGPSRLVDLPETWCGMPTRKYVPAQPVLIENGLCTFCDSTGLHPR